MSQLKVSIPLKVSRRELATILAALRFHQDENLQGQNEIPDQMVKNIASDAGFFRPLNFSEVSDLCERINLGQEPAGWQTCRHQWQSTSGPTTGVGIEDWFRCACCNATKYRCTEQDGSYKEETHPPTENPGKEECPHA